MLYYSFSAEMRAIIRDSRIFARLHKDVILHLSSRYSLALYELCRKRVNLEHTWSEEFTVDRFRQLLGVEPGRLDKFKHLNERAIQPAIAEINFLCDFGCAVEPVLAGRKAVKIKLSWWRKNAEERKAAFRELQAAKIGRKARLKGTVEQVVPPLERITGAPSTGAPSELPPPPVVPPPVVPKVGDGVTVDLDQAVEFYRQQLVVTGKAGTPQAPGFFIMPIHGSAETIEKLRRLLEAAGIKT
jgi:hypothetical protein